MAGGRFFSFLDEMTFVEDDSSSYEINISDSGFSYLDLLSEKKAKRIAFEEKQKRQTSAALDGSTRAHGKLNIKKVEAVDHDALCLDTNLEKIISDIQERRQKVPVFPWCVALVVILFALWVLMPQYMDMAWLAMLLSGVILFPGSAVLLWNAWKLDISRRHVKFAYRLEGKGKAAFDAISRSVSNLAKCDQVLLYQGRRHFEDTRYSGGAQSLPILDPAKINQRRPPLLDLEFDVWHVRADRRDLFFMPDSLMVFEGAQVGGIKYSDLKLVSNVETIQARDKAVATSDCKVVGETYRFVNNDGTPDQRFNNNTPVPLIEHGVFGLSGSGLDLRLYASFQSSALSAPQGFDVIRDLANMPLRKTAADRRQNAMPKASKQVPSIHSALLDCVCCMMVADGRAASTERDQIRDLMKRLGAPWDTAGIDSRINDFILGVRKDGFQKTLDSVCAILSCVKGDKNARTFLQCLEAVAKSDGEIDARERDTFNRMKAALSAQHSP